MAASGVLALSQLTLDDALPPSPVIFGRSKAMLGVRLRLESVAGTNVPVLIHGESGTGKEVMAKVLHQTSPWSEGPFVKVSCPAIPATLMESELFGYERGAFTGAYGSKPGRVEMARRGTLFLDEIGELDSGLQAKLLQLVQDGQFCRIGAHQEKRVEARMVCATNRDLHKEIQAGSFRADLFYRINVLNLSLPPLRERVDDIPELAEYFVRTYSRAFSKIIRPMSRDSVRLLQGYDWPGNIRQMENLIKRLVILGSEDVLVDELLGSPTTTMLPEIPEDDSLGLKEITQQVTQEVERRVILKTLQTHHWNRKKAAVALKISYRALLYKMQQAGLPSRSMLRKDVEPEDLQDPVVSLN